MQNPPSGAAGKSSTGLDENIAALLSYVFGWVSGLIFFLMEKESRLVRFHAMQSILFNVLIAVVLIVGWIVTGIVVVILAQVADAMGAIAGLLATLIWLVISVGILITFILCLVRAYQGRFFKLPIIGNFAEKFANK